MVGEGDHEEREEEAEPLRVIKTAKVGDGERTREGKK